MANESNPLHRGLYKFKLTVEVVDVVMQQCKKTLHFFYIRSTCAVKVHVYCHLDGWVAAVYGIFVLVVRIYFDTDVGWYVPGREEIDPSWTKEIQPDGTIVYGPEGPITHFKNSTWFKK